VPADRGDFWLTILMQETVEEKCIGFKTEGNKGKSHANFLRWVGELDSVVGERGVDTVGDGFEEGVEEGGGGPQVGRSTSSTTANFAVRLIRVNAMPPSQNPQALLTMLYRSTGRRCRCGAPV
jgi:hypothetical protein